MQENVKQIIAETLVKFRIGWYLTILMISIKLLNYLNNVSFSKG
jgi:hypothetical protein